MKKTYIIPELSITMLGVENMIALSGTDGVEGLGVNNDGTQAAGVTSGNVKGTSSYNVWDDDWSNN